MPSALEAGPEESVDDRERKRLGENARPQGEDVRIVVLPGEARREFVGTQRGSDAVHLVRSNLLPLAAPAEHDAELGLGFDDGTPHRRTKGRIVDGFLRIGSEIDDFVTGCFKVTGDRSFQCVTGVISSERNPHEGSILTPPAGGRGFRPY